MDIQGGLWLFLGLVGLVINAAVAGKFEKIAHMKGHKGYFWWCFFLGAIGWRMVTALPDRGQKPAQINTPPAL